MSRTETQAILGLAGRSTLNEFLRGVPPPDWTRRPNAKDDLRDKARQLRVEGLNYNQITARLGVSKSSVSLWVRDLPTPPGLSYEENRRRSAEGARRYWDEERKVRQAHQANERIAAAAEIGELTPREILIAGAVAYWCEGAKSKPHRQQYCVAFMNSDPGLIRLFLRFLDIADIPRSDLVFTVCIHESGRGSSPAVLAQGHTGQPRAVQQAVSQASQPKDYAKERRRGLPRLPTDRRPPEQRSRAEDRRLVTGDHGGSDGRRGWVAKPALVAPVLPEKDSNPR